MNDNDSRVPGASPARVPRRRAPLGALRRSRVARRALRVTAACVLTVLVLTGGPDAAHAADHSPAVVAAASIQAVVNNIRTWIVGILVAVATLFLTVGGLRYLAANGDPGEVERAKLALRSAALGYALALLAPLFVTIIGQWVA